MQDRTNVKERIFNDFKTKIQELSETHSVEDLLQKSDQFTELQNLLTTLKVLANYPLENIENENINEDLSIDSQEKIAETKDVIHQEKLLQEESTTEEAINTEETLEEKGSATDNEESKVKLANIKGLKPNLFEDEPLQEMTQEHEKKEEKVQEETKKQNFKLDLNDKIAFTKTLFDGSQMELNETIQILNNFDDLEKAKEYLSDLYYKKNWEKADEYAQRLWSLVENKFH